MLLTAMHVNKFFQTNETVIFLQNTSIRVNLAKHCEAVSNKNKLYFYLARPTGAVSDEKTQMGRL